MYPISSYDHQIFTYGLCYVFCSFWLTSLGHDFELIAAIAIGIVNCILQAAGFLSKRPEA